MRPADVGKRVTIQFFDDTGARREAVGVLERVEKDGDTTVFLIRKRDESLVRVPAPRVRFGRVIRSR